jgi:hypothetical protein
MRKERRSPRIDRMRSLIADFRILYSVQQQARRENMGAFLSRFAEQHRQSSAQQMRFNVFSLLQVETDEVRHSRFLAWLLDPESGHGQGSAFLKAFVIACRLDIASEVSGRYRVRTEFAGMESIIDVFVYHPGEFLIYLENKISASEGPRQIDREFRDMRRLGDTLRVPQARQFAVFLTPDGRCPVSGDSTRWRPVSYGDIAAEFATLLPRITQDKVRFTLEDWLETVSAFGGAL